MTDHVTPMPSSDLSSPTARNERVLAEADRFGELVDSILNGAEPENPYRTLAAARDQRAVEDEQYFARRFGFDWPRRDRVGLFELKHAYDVTDRQIQFFRWTGNLKRQNGTVALAATRGWAVYGQCLIAWMLLMVALVVTRDAFAIPRVPLMDIARLCGLAAFVAIGTWGVHLGFVEPWRAQCRILHGANAATLG